MTFRIVELADKRVCSLLILCFVFCLPTELQAQMELVEPEPFRRDSGQLEGREYIYGKQDFVDRFSYRFDPDLRRLWDVNDEGVRVTGGSISTDETYTVAQFKKRWFVDDYFFGTLRYIQDEDYDDDFNRFLYGLGAAFAEQWSVTLLSDVERDKENIDIHIELAWNEYPRKDILFEQQEQSDTNENQARSEGQGGSRARLALVLVDAPFNGATEAGRYRDDPITIFGEGLWRVAQRSFVHAWTNYTPEFELELDDAAEDLYSFEQLRAGFRTEIGVAENSVITLGAKGEYTDSRGGAETLRSRSLSRHNFITDLEYRTDIRDDLRGWLGYRYLIFDEEDLRPDQRENQLITDRKEHVFHGGVRWRLTQRYAFRPSLFLTLIDNEDRIGDETSEDFELRSDSELLGRILLPFEMYFPYRNAVLILNPTLEWPGDAFGGFNVQFQLSL